LSIKRSRNARPFSFPKHPCLPERGAEQNVDKELYGQKKKFSDHAACHEHERKRRKHHDDEQDALNNIQVPVTKSEVGLRKKYDDTYNPHHG